MYSYIPASDCLHVNIIHISRHLYVFIHSSIRLFVCKYYSIYSGIRLFVCKYYIPGICMYSYIPASDCLYVNTIHTSRHLYVFIHPGICMYSYILASVCIHTSRHLYVFIHPGICMYSYILASVCIHTSRHQTVCLYVVVLYVITLLYQFNVLPVLYKRQ